MLTVGLSTALGQFFRPKYTTTIFRISKGLGCSSIGKTMTRDLRFGPAMRRALGYIRNRKTEGKIIQNQKHSPKTNRMVTSWAYRANYTNTNFMKVFENAMDLS